MSMNVNQSLVCFQRAFHTFLRADAACIAEEVLPLPFGACLLSALRFGLARLAAEPFEVSRSVAACHDGRPNTFS